jgi:NAD(P)H dehydrogenase (quinone)
MIVVTGANGQLGSQIVEQLLVRVPADQLGVSVRDVQRSAELSSRGVRVRAGDFTDPARLLHAFEGATQVLVVSAAIRGGGALTANNAAIDAARAAGARRVLYTSHQGSSPTALFPPHTVHAATEAHLAASGLPSTAFRNGFYASTLAVNIGSALTTGTIAAPADGPVSWTAHADLAEAIAIALSEEGTLDGITPPLTATEMLDLEQVADILSDITGRSITRVVMDDEVWKAAAIGRGLSPMVADFSLGMYRAARAGEYAIADPTLEHLLGRSTTPARVTLERIVAAAA